MKKNINSYKDFAVFILSNNRADRVLTYNSLVKQGYTGRIFIVVDDEDNQLKQYQEKFSNVVIFSKKEAASTTDTFDTIKRFDSVVFARNMIFKIAKSMNLKTFLVLDDDYTQFTNRINERGDYKKSGARIKNLDNYFIPILDFFTSNDIDCLALSQGGDYAGGKKSQIIKKYKQADVMRKAMNAFFFKSDRVLGFAGRLNEDVNMYVSEGKIGKKIFTLANIRIEQQQTQKHAGGLTPVYLDVGTYVKSFYSVSFVKLS